MLMYRRTGLFESSAQTLVNTVNCVGVMGKGIAKEFKSRNPDMFEVYKRLCAEGKIAPGKLWLWRGADNFVLNFPTKIHWRNPSKLEWIELGLQKFVKFHEEMGIREISFPRLGCGNGNLNWEDVRPMMERYLSPLKIQVYIHDHEVDVGIPEHLEYASKVLDKEFPNIRSFDDFYYALKRAVEVTKDSFVDVTERTPIKASFKADGDLMFETAESCTSFEEEDLRGVWFSLQQGLVTEEKAGWSSRKGGRPLLSLLSLLPNVRPIEIQRIEKRPEVAVELDVSTRKNATITEPRQTELAWH